MRKRLKLKKKSCAMCKPHKMRGGNRWKAQEEQALKEWERDKNFDQGETI